MASLNKILIMGNLTRDPETRVLPKGTTVTKFGLALNRSYKTDSGEKKEDVIFVAVECFGKTAELSAKYLSKGRSALVEGRLKMDIWDDKKTGEKRSRLGVVADSVTFIGGGRGGEGGAASNAATDTPAGQPQAQPSPDDDVPF